MIRGESSTCGGARVSSLILEGANHASTPQGVAVGNLWGEVVASIVVQLPPITRSEDDPTIQQRDGFLDDDGGIVD